MNINYDNFVGGVIKEKKPDRRDFIAGSILLPDVKYPDEFIIGSKDKFPVKMQWFTRGSCTSQAIATCHEPDENIPLSARFQFILTKRLEGNKDFGAYLLNNLKIMQKFGSIPEIMLSEPDANMSYEDYLDTKVLTDAMIKEAEKHKIGSYWFIEKNEDLRNVLYQFNKDLPPEKQKGIYMAIDWYRGFNNPINGIMPALKDWGENYSSHAVVLCGYNKNYLIFKNSFSDKWGDKGYFYFGKNLPRWSAFAFKDERGFPVENRYGQKWTPEIGVKEWAMLMNVWLKKKIGRQPNDIEIRALAVGKHDFEIVYKGVIGDAWLYWTKKELIQRGYPYEEKLLYYRKGLKN